MTNARIVDTFAGVLLDSPLDSNLIADVAYSASQTLDGRHFADEFIRRKKLADRGVFDKDVTLASESKNNSNGGWNEVAKKGGSTAPKEDTSIAGFRMVASKKGKGKKN
jgi:PERQ amino acid-rich with GYF domain-containing protein